MKNATLASVAQFSGQFFAVSAGNQRADVLAH